MTDHVMRSNGIYNTVISSRAALRAVNGQRWMKITLSAALFMCCLPFSMLNGCTQSDYLIHPYRFIVRLSETFNRLNMNPPCKLSTLERFLSNYMQKMLLIVFSLATINTGFAPHLKMANKATGNNINWNLNSNSFSTTMLPQPVPLQAKLPVQRPPPNDSYMTTVDGSSLHRHYNFLRCKKFYNNNRLQRISGFDYFNVDFKPNNNNNNNNNNKNKSNYRLSSSLVSNSENNPSIKNINRTMALRTINTIDVELFEDNDNDNFNGNSTLDNSPMNFGTENLTVVTTQVGANAHVPCVVHNIGDSVVSWIRKKDYHLLTVGLTVYSSDERFSTTHHKHADDWTLQIKYVQPRDAGIYECQVSTHPPTSIFLHLNVIEARAEISGPLIRYLTPGSMLRLHCRILQNTETSDYIFWYNDNRMINYDTDRGIIVSTEPDFQSSELIIAKTRREHSGNYTCVARNAQSASVLVHIFKGDNPAAMYHGNVRCLRSFGNKHLIVITIIMIIMDLKKQTKLPTICLI